MSFYARIRRSPLVVGPLLGAAAIAVSAPRPASAQERGAADKVTQLNKKAVDAYENLDFDEARKLLKQALDVSAAAHMGRHRLTARTHIHLGVVLLSGFKQRDLAVKQFRQALAIEPTITLTRSLANPEVQAAFDEAKASAGSPAAGEEAEEAPEASVESPAAPRDTPPEGLTGLHHDIVTEGYRGHPVEVKAAVGSDVSFDKVVLAYRPKGAADYLAREMTKNDKGWFVAQIPTAATDGDVVAYYIEVRDKAGKPQVANGSAGEPNLVALSSEPPPPPPPVIAKRRRAPVEVDEEGGAGAEGKAEPEGEAGAERATGEEEEQPKPRRHRRRHADEPAETAEVEHPFLVAIGVGSGAGWTQGKPELNAKDLSGQDVLIQPGVAPASLVQFVPEIGYYLSPDVILSLQARIQIVSGASTVYDPNDPACGSGGCQPAKGAIAVFLKATWLLGDESGKLHPYFALSVGFGTIRHIVNLAPATLWDDSSQTGCAGANQPCYDTVRGGDFFAGPGVGLFYDLTKSVAFTVGLASQVGVPDVTVNGDFNLGLAVHL